MTYSDNTRPGQTSEKLADRIRKLLALAGNNPSEAEAAAAMERASALMAEHNLTMAKVTTLGTEDERIAADHDGQHARMTWARAIWGAVARLNFCLYSYRTPEPNGGTERIAGGRIRSTEPHIGDRHSLIGTRANVTSTQVMALYLVETVERMARECPDIHGMHEHHAFKLGCARRLAQRLDELLKQRMAAERKAQTPATSSNLPTLASLYSTHDVANNRLFQELHGYKLCGGGYGPTTSHRGAYERGKRAGNDIGLNAQVNSQRRLPVSR